MAAGAPGAAVITGGGRLPATHCQTSSGTWVVGVGKEDWSHFTDKETEDQGVI